MSELVKRQHFVPRTYLKHFGFEKNKANYIWVLPKASTTEQDIFDSNVQNVALKKHLYTLPGKTVAQKMMIEKFYSKQLEDKYDQIHSLLVDPGKTAISATERELIIMTVVTMFY
jgi:hypothetical protein